MGELLQQIGLVSSITGVIVLALSTVMNGGEFQ